jgi:arginyl-tRNA synthetase
MHALEKIKLDIAKKINQALKKDLVKASDLIYPVNPKFGDLSLPCFELGKIFKKSSVQAAEWLLSELAKLEIYTVKAIGPYLNFTLDKKMLAENVIKEISKENENFGKNKGGKNKRVMIEYSNANTHKEYHVGHLRNIIYGDAITKLLSANGFKAIPVSYINDFGIHVAKTLWALTEFFKNEKLPKNKGYFLGKVYVHSNEEYEKQKTAKEKVSLIMKKIESRKGPEYELWKKTRQWSIEEHNKIYKELDVKFNHIYYESEVIGAGLDMAAELYKKNFLIKSEGAIIADLEKYNLGVLVFLRADGTALYPVADLSLAFDKFKKYKPENSIYIVDIRQDLYFKQLFKILELQGLKKNVLHLGYEFVKLPSGMMSSRIGNVITYEDLKEEMMKKELLEIKKRHQGWSDKKIKETAEKIVIGALKFEMIKIGREKIITFDINEALKFEGYTSIYLQYTYARIRSIFRKSNSKCQMANSKKELLREEKEACLILKMAKYPEIVAKAGANYEPSEIAKYLFELAQEFNDYYHSVPVLQAKKDIKVARLALINSINQIIANGLSLLGIEILEEM